MLHNQAPDYYSSEWWMVYITFILAAITGALAFYTWKLYSATVSLGIEAKATAVRQAEEMQRSLAIASKSADAADHANRLNRDAYIADQRPWVTCEITLESGLRLEDSGVVVPMQFVLRNTGKSPALDIDIFVEIFACFGNVSPTEYQREIAARERQRPFGESGRGDTLFPGDHIIKYISTPLKKSDIERYDEVRNNSGATTAGHLPPIVVLGFVDYKTPFDAEHHQTGFVLDLWWINPANPNTRKSVVPKLTDELPELPITELILVNSWLGSGYTN